MSRIMIINWKFKNTTKSTENCESYNISNSNDDELICCNSNDPKKINDIIETKDAKNNKILVMLHKNVPNTEVVYQEIKSCGKASCKICVFEGGSETIYYNQFSRPKGLLGNIDDLAKTAKDGSNIKKEHFDFVWDFYWNLCKKKLYELKEELLFCLYPLTFQEKKDFNECVNNNMLLGLRIKDFIGEEELKEEELTKIKKLEEDQNNYYLFSDCHDYYQQKGGDLYKNLKETLKNILNNNTDKIMVLIKIKFYQIFPEPTLKTIPEFLRYQFDLLLNTLDEPIY